jgi:hypothetical protein
MGIADSLKEQFDRGWRMVGATVWETPEDVWRTGGRDYLCPARLAYHIAETVEFYLSEQDEFPFGRRFGGDWEQLPPERLPSREQAAAYLAEVRRQATDWLVRHDDAALLGPNERHRWCGPTLLDLALYVLRHTLHHHGEMNALSVLAGTDTDNWA